MHFFSFCLLTGTHPLFVSLDIALQWKFYTFYIIFFFFRFSFDILSFILSCSVHILLLSCVCVCSRNPQFQIVPQSSSSSPNSCKVKGALGCQHYHTHTPSHIVERKIKKGSKKRNIGSKHEIKCKKKNQVKWYNSQICINSFQRVVHFLFFLNNVHCISPTTTHH